LIATAVASYSSKYWVRVPVQKWGTRFGSFHTSNRHWRTSSIPYRSIQCSTVRVTSSTQRVMSLGGLQCARHQNSVSVWVARSRGMKPSSTKGRAPLSRMKSKTLST
jgi:hypothetical protein